MSFLLSVLFRMGLLNRFVNIPVLFFFACIGQEYVVLASHIYLYIVNTIGWEKGSLVPGVPGRQGLLTIDIAHETIMCIT